MSMRYPGGLIASSPVNAAYPSGVWTQAQTQPYAAQNVWMRDQFWPNTTLLLQGNGTNGAQNNTFLDSSTNNFTITRNGNTTQGSFTPYEANGYWSNYFNGSSSLHSNVSGVAAGTSTFTFEVWVFLNAYPGSDAPFYDTRSSNGASTTGMQFGVYSTGALKFYDGTETNLGGIVPLNQWVHIALVRNGSNVMTPYINGNATGTTVSSTRNFTDQYFWIGSVPGPASPYINAYFSNLRWVVGTAVYTSNFTPSTAPLTAITNTKLLTCQSNRFIDNSTNAYAITVNGSPSVQAFQPFPGATTWSGSVLGGSGYFDGSGDYLSVADSAPLELGSGNWTIECWVYTSNSTAYSALITRDDGATTAGSYVILLNGASANGLISFWAADVNSFSAAVLQGTVKCNDSAWHHIAIVRNGNTLTLYIDGTSNSTASYSGAFANTAQPILIGAETGYPREYTGYISNVRYVIGTAVYTANFTPPTAPLTAITNTQLLLSFTNAGIFDAATINNLETVGNAQVSTSVVKYGTGSMAFDGSGDYLVSAATNLPFTFGTGDFTIECWIYPVSVSGATITIVSNRFDAGADTVLIFAFGTTNGLYFHTQATAVLNSGTNLTANTWQHVALCRAGGTVRIFLNGVQVGSSASSAQNLSATASVFVGQDGTKGAGAAAQFNGYIDDLRITKGAARYITNFTPPIARLPAQ